MQDKVVIGGSISLRSRISGDCNLTSFIEGDAGKFLPLYPDPYTGETVITPSEEQQVLQTQGLTTLTNILVNPIPDNYGRILYNGTTLKVY